MLAVPGWTIKQTEMPSLNYKNRISKQKKKNSQPAVWPLSWILFMYSLTVMVQCHKKKYIHEMKKMNRWMTKSKGVMELLLCCHNIPSLE